MFTDDETEYNFLSCLCGSELLGDSMATAFLFLSCLCGSELTQAVYRMLG
ncbi:hypothetical protein VC116063_003790 [Vibrio cholerae O1 str. 116063]|nr:hypothetical protein VC116063_003790 [Vibrio cholerae O1 str. 116063]